MLAARCSLDPKKRRSLVPGCRMTILVLPGTAVSMRRSMPPGVSPMTPALVTLASMPRSLRMVCNRAGKAFAAPTPQPAVLLAPTTTMLSERMTGPDAKDEHHRYRKYAHYRHHDCLR